MTLTLEQIDAITAMLADATPGPWALSDLMTITTDDPPERAVYIAYAGESIRNHRNMPLIVALRNAAPALLAAARAVQRKPIETAPKDGTPILVDFGSKGIHRVGWTEPACDDHQAWCVDDLKHGPFPLRGYKEEDIRGWLPLPTPPETKT